MNGILRILITCVTVFCVASEIVQVIKPEIEKYGDQKQVKFFVNNQNSNNGARQVDSTVYQTVNKYYCSLDSLIEGSHLMVYGNQGWTFPAQDVNLTLRYPPENKAPGYFQSIFNVDNVSEDDEQYLITGFKVILYIDGPGSEGYINDGGVLQDSITLSFISSQLTSLSYEFWLYGARRDTPGVVELNSHYRPGLPLECAAPKQQDSNNSVQVVEFADSSQN